MIIAFKTLGCKTNQAETAALQTMLQTRDHEIATPGQRADIVVVNTCTVTAESSRKSRQAVRRARAEHPGCKVAVCGCLSQLSPAEVVALQADLIGGSGDRAAFADAIERMITGPSQQTKIDNARERRGFELLPAGGLAGHTRALLKVQDGCDNFCTYCIIPYARGPVRSLPLDAALQQAGELAKAGYKELVITGIEISSWGKDLAGGPSIADFIAALCQAVPDMRIRLGSLEPRTITTEFCARLCDIKNLCPHFHLSLQAGSDEILKRMGRHYDTERYLKSVHLLRQTFPHPAITTDLIVGFPGEYAADFDKSLAFLQSCAFAAVHVFPYSPRKGTKAADMKNQVPKAERTRRAKLAGAIARNLAGAWQKSQIGSTQAVLFEEEKNGQSIGHTPNYCKVALNEPGLHKQVRQVRIVGVSDGVLLGEL